MDLKPTLIILSIVALASFVFGRYSVKLPPDSKTQEEKVVDIKNQTDTDTHKVTIIEKDCKTGVETTTITEDMSSREKETQKTVDNLYQELTQQKRKTTNISAMAAIQELKPVYGASASMEVFGPATAGVFALTNGTFGFSIGLNF